MKRGLSVALALCVLCSLGGCAAPLIIGAAAGGLGAYAISKDTVQADSDKDFDSLWESALDVSRQSGVIQQENISTGYIELTVGSSKVWIRFIRLTRATTRIRISARKYHFPNIGLAQDIFVKIISGVK
ncbi:MAG: DUF3568 family protein [Candidatus Omnitrophica bacterium]|nr:DUF3568 family protein [Candidatus Omnitrophota bacterium]